MEGMIDCEKEGLLCCMFEKNVVHKLKMILQYAFSMQFSQLRN